MTEKHGPAVIRAASSDLGFLDDLSHATTIAELLDLASRSPMLWMELHTFHPTLIDQADNIVSGKEKRSKIIRKTARTLSGLLARSAFRATPSRLIGSVGTIYSNATQSPGEVRLNATATITASSTTNVRPGSSMRPNVLRWNPSALVMEGRCYLTAPRTPEIDAFSSVGVNSLIEGIQNWARVPVSADELRSNIYATYPDADDAAVDHVLNQLVDHEVLLTDGDVGYHTYRAQRRDICADITLGADGFSQMSPDELADKDVDTYRHAVGSLPNGMVDNLRDYLNHGLEHGVFEHNDSGIAEVLAQLILEKFGAARVPLTHLLHPVFGVDWRTVKRTHQQRGSGRLHSSAYHQAVFTRGTRSATGWVDLREETSTLPKVDRSYSDVDSLDLIASMHGTSEDPVYNVADAISSLPGNVSTSRFDLLETESPADPYAVNIDWVSPQKAFNSVREAKAYFPRTINVNSVEHTPGELTLNDLFMWSDGTRVHLCDNDGIPVHFRPTSMAGIGAYPEWLMQVAMTATAFTPNINFSWGSIAGVVAKLGQ